MSNSEPYENPFATDTDGDDAPKQKVNLPLELTGTYDEYDLTSIRMFQNPIQICTSDPITVSIQEEYIEFESKLGQTRYSWKNTKSIRIVGTCAVIQCGTFHGSLIIPKHWCPEELWEPLIDRIKRIISNSDELTEFEIPEVEPPENAFILKRKLVTFYEQYLHLKIHNVYLSWGITVRAFFGVIFLLSILKVRSFEPLVRMLNQYPTIMLLLLACLGLIGMIMALPFLFNVIIRNIFFPPLLILIMLYFRTFPPDLDLGPCWIEEEKSCLFTKNIQSIIFWNQYESLYIHDHVICMYAPTTVNCIYRSQFDSAERWNEFVELIKGKIPNRITLKEFHRQNPIVTSKEIRVMQKKVRDDQKKNK
jgi:hypothetical protein